MPIYFIYLLQSKISTRHQYLSVEKLLEKLNFVAEQLPVSVNSVQRVKTRSLYIYKRIWMEVN